MPLMTVILATRDRPDLFSEALASVASQTLDDIEIVIVNDGSSEDSRKAYESIYQQFSSRFDEGFQTHWLTRREKGHGQSYSLNYGVSHARGEFVCFLDDDDTWTDRDYLKNVTSTIHEKSGAGCPLDLLMSNQAAYANGNRQQGIVWLEGLEEEIKSRGRQPTSAGAYDITVTDLMSTHGFCHINVFVIRRELFEAIGGMDEGLRWECDRDLFLRLIDTTSRITFMPHFVSRHNIPDPYLSASMTTSTPMLAKRLFQLQVHDKAMLFSMQAEIRAYGRLHKGYVLRTIAEELAAGQRFRDAFVYARQALGVKFGIKWAVYTLYLGARSFMQQSR